MKKGIVCLASCLIAASLLLPSCAPVVSEETLTAPPEEQELPPEEVVTEEETATQEEPATEEEVTATEEPVVEEEVTPTEEPVVEEEEAPAAEGVIAASPYDAVKHNPGGYDTLFTHGNLHHIEIIITQEEWDGLIQDMKDYAATDRSGKGMTGNYRKATFVYTGPAGDAIIEEVGFRTKGHYTRPIPEDDDGNFHRAHFKVKFNATFDLEPGTEEYAVRRQTRFSKQRSLELRLNLQDVRWDNSQIRELFSYDLMNKAGVYTSRTGSATLTITIGGEKHYFGVYTLIETFNKSFLTRRYGAAGNDGNLYKCLWGDSGPATLEPLDAHMPNPVFTDERIIGVKDWRTHYRPTYDLKTNEEVADHTELIDFIAKINTLSGDEFKEYIDANFEIDRFLRYQAMNMLIGKWDDYWAMGNNYYLYFNNDGKIEFMSNDYDMALGQGFQLFDAANVGIYDWGNRCRQFLSLVAPQIPESWLDTFYDYESPLIQKIFEIDEYRAKYEYYLKEFITPENKLFVYSEYEKKFNRLHSLYAPYLYNDMDEGELMINDDSVREYFYQRTRSIVKQLGLNEEDYELSPRE